MIYDLSELIDLICLKIIYICVIILIFDKLRVIATNIYDKWLESSPEPRDTVIERLKLKLVEKNIEIRHLKSKFYPIPFKNTK